MNLIEQLEELTAKCLAEEIDPADGEEIKQPTEEDKDGIYDALQVLNKCEWFVSAEESKKIQEVENILNKLI